MSKRDMILAVLLTALALAALWCGKSSAALPEGYTGRVELTVAGATGSHTDMALVYELDPSDLLGVAANGADIRVFTSSGTMLDHEIVTWGVDEAIIWFKPGTVADDEIYYLYYANEDSSEVGVGDLWSDYGPVYHFEENPAAGVLDDHSGNGTHAYTEGTWEPGFRVPGALGSAWHYESFRGTAAPDVNVTGEWAISAWMRPNSASTDVMIQGNPWWYFLAVQASSGNTQPSAVFRYGDWAVSYAFSGCANDNTWAKYDFVYTLTPDTTITVYRNGTACTNTGIFQIGTANEISAWYELGYDIDLLGRNFNSQTTALGIASQSFIASGNQQDQFHGYADEYQIWDGETSGITADWVTTQYANQSDPETFFDSTITYPLASKIAIIHISPTIVGLRNTNQGQITIVPLDFDPDDESKNFGTRPVVDESWTGGIIESHASQTPADTVQFAPKADDWTTQFTPSFTVKPVLSDLQAHSGSQSIKTSINRLDGETWSLPLTFWTGNTYTKVFFTYWTWRRFHGANLPVNAEQGINSQIKTWRVYGEPLPSGDHLSNKTGEVYSNERWHSTGNNSVDMDLWCESGCSGSPYEGLGSRCWSSGTVAENYSHAIYSGEFPSENRWERASIYLDAGTTFGTAIPYTGDAYMDISYHFDDESDPWHPYDLSGLQFITSLTADCKTTPADYFQYLTFENFLGWAGINAEVFYDDIYVQTGTQARVEIGNDPDYESCTLLEIQPIVNNGWRFDGGSITFSYNPGGAFPSVLSSDDGPQYIFVVKDDGTVTRGVFLPPVRTPRDKIHISPLGEGGR